MSNETKAQKFTRLTEKRMGKIEGHMLMLYHCTNRGNYDYSSIQAKNIITRLQRMVDRLEIGFQDLKTQFGIQQSSANSIEE